MIINLTNGQTYVTQADYKEVKEAIEERKFFTIRAKNTETEKHVFINPKHVVNIEVSEHEMAHDDRVSVNKSKTFKAVK